MPRPSMHAAENSRELSATFHQLADALRQDSMELQREVILWQRFIRYAAAGTAAAGSLLLLSQGAMPRTWVPIMVVAAIYLFFNGLTAWFLKHGSPKGIPPSLPAVVLGFDMAMMSSLVYFSTPPAQFHRILLLGFLVLQLTVFYFGMGAGVWAWLVTMGVYAMGSFVLPPWVSGVRPTVTTVSFNLATFLLVGGVLLFTFGRFRDRLNKLRVFCKRVEIGDLVGSYDTDKDKRPDDLTLLARSVDSMRHRLIELIGTDPLTGCLNRRAFEARLSREWRIAKRRDAMLALLAIDLDKFKPINDTYGHPIGDMVLVELAQIMKHTARESDAVARLGGDEFMILLPDTGWQGATTFAERLRRHVDEHMFGGDEAALQVTISVGVALARGTDNVTPDYLLEEADRSLYKAKSSGRNRISA
jgi:diguanylate cyclase (GGDEF)-like protein